LAVILRLAKRAEDIPLTEKSTRASLRVDFLFNLALSPAPAPPIVAVFSQRREHVHVEEQG
jgi:hypothetical protein